MAVVGQRWRADHALVGGDAEGGQTAVGTIVPFTRLGARLGLSAVGLVVLVHTALGEALPVVFTGVTEAPVSLGAGRVGEGLAALILAHDLEAVALVAVFCALERGRAGGAVAAEVTELGAEALGVCAGLQALRAQRAVARSLAW